MGCAVMWGRVVWERKLVKDGRDDRKQRLGEIERKKALKDDRVNWN